MRRGPGCAGAGLPGLGDRTGRPRPGSGHRSGIDRKLREGASATVVLASGEIAEVVAERIVFSAQTAHLFERAVTFVDTGDGTAAEAVELDAWATYNIEVEELHTDMWTLREAAVSYCATSTSDFGKATICAPCEILDLAEVLHNEGTSL